MSITYNIEKVLNHWGLDDAVIIPIDSPSQSTWDIDGKYILKKTSRFSNADELKRGIQFSNLLIKQGISVAAFVPATNRQLTTPDDEYCLMTKLPGKHADFYKEPHLAFEMGHELARLHMALATIEAEITYSDSDLLADWKNWIKPKAQAKKQLFLGLSMQPLQGWPYRASLPESNHRGLRCGWKLSGPSMP